MRVAFLHGPASVASNVASCAQWSPDPQVGTGHMLCAGIPPQAHSNAAPDCWAGAGKTRGCTPVLAWGLGQALRGQFEGLVRQVGMRWGINNKTAPLWLMCARNCLRWIFHLCRWRKWDKPLDEPATGCEDVTQEVEGDSQFTCALELEPPPGPGKLCFAPSATEEMHMGTKCLCICVHTRRNSGVHVRASCIYVYTYYGNTCAYLCTVDVYTCVCLHARVVHSVRICMLCACAHACVYVCSLCAHTCTVAVSRLSPLHI